MTLSRRDLFTGLLRRERATAPEAEPTEPEEQPGADGPPAPELPEIRLQTLPRRGSSQVEGIPVMWVLPRGEVASPRLALWLCGGIGGMSAAGRELEALAERGFIAVSFDSWGRGARADGTMAGMFPRMTANYAQLVWPLIGNGALEVLRILDWAQAEFPAAPPFCIGGHALGGDIAVTAARLDRRIGCVAAITASPDWRRPGMRALGKPMTLGQPDAYARWFYEQLDPLSHAASFEQVPAITFECGADDDHVPPDGALRFQQALRAGPYASSPQRVHVNLHEGVGHEYVPAMWENCLDWFSRHAGPHPA